MASFLNGTFGGPEQYCAEDMEVYVAGPVLILDKSTGRASPHFNSATFGEATANYGSDDFELESAGSIHSLHNGGRSGDTLFKNGGFD